MSSRRGERLPLCDACSCPWCAHRGNVPTGGDRCRLAGCGSTITARRSATLACRGARHSERVRGREGDGVGVTFPGESAEYRAVRDRLLDEERDLRRAIEAVA